MTNLSQPETTERVASILEILSAAVEQAAVAAHTWVGKGDSHAADAAATAAMRSVFSRAPFGVHVVIGEGERDSAPMLARGERLGAFSAFRGNAEGPEADLILDCAVDPLDGTSLLKNGLPGAITVAVLADAGGIATGDGAVESEIGGGEATQVEFAVSGFAAGACSAEGIGDCEAAGRCCGPGGGV